MDEMSIEKKWCGGGGGGKKQENTPWHENGVTVAWINKWGSLSYSFKIEHYKRINWYRGGFMNTL